MNEQRREILYTKFMSRLKNEEIYHSLKLSGKLNCMKYVSKIFQNLDMERLELLMDEPHLITNHINSRGYHRLAKLRDFVKELDRIETFEDEESEEVFKEEIRNKLNMRE